MNKYQKMAARTYAGGDYAHVAGYSDAQLKTALDDGEFGDTLFEFIMRELDDDCEDLEEVVRRMEKAADQVNAVATALMSEGDA